MSVSKRAADKGYNISISFQCAAFTADAHENSVLHGKESLKTGHELKKTYTRPDSMVDVGITDVEPLGSYQTENKCISKQDR